MTTQMKRSIAGFAAASILSVSLAALSIAAADSAAAQAKPVPPGGGALTSELPDIIPTTLGFVMKSGPVKWGDSVDLMPAQADAIQVGPKKDLCRFYPGAYRTFNKGDGDAGAFVTKTFVGGKLVHTHNVPGGLKSKDYIDWHKFNIDLKEGMNVIRVVFDANKQVAETDENNTYSIRVNVKIDCDGDGYIGAKPVGGSLKVKPGQPDPDPQPRKLRLQPRG